MSHVDPDVKDEDEDDCSRDRLQVSSMLASRSSNLQQPDAYSSL